MASRFFDLPQGTLHAWLLEEAEYNRRESRASNCCLGLYNASTWLILTGHGQAYELERIIMALIAGEMPPEVGADFVQEFGIDAWAKTE